MESGYDWRKDRWLWAALVVAVVLRVLPLILFPVGDCVRDECIYRSVAARLLDGEGMTTTSKGWLPAPGYPVFLAAMKTVFGVTFSAKVIQIPVSCVSLWTTYAIGMRLQGRRLALVGAWLFALHPTLVFYTTTLWVETVYIFLLLLAMLWGMWAREGAWSRGLVPGLALGVATLFRGIATYLPPIFALALIWPEEGQPLLSGLREGLRARWKHALALGLGWVLMVAPYSMWASPQQGGFMITDATVGHVMFLGNNDFPPLTFDYGIGMLDGRLYGKWLRLGRRPCDRNQPPVVSSKCEVGEAVKWIEENPAEFVRRIPTRLAQMLNPNSFLTRHVRWGYWSQSDYVPMPWWLKDLIAASVIAWTMAIVLGGTLAAWARAKGPYAVMAVGTVIYTMLTISAMYGMTRFRLPLEALWLPYLGLLFVDPRGVLHDLLASPWRAAGAVVTLPVLTALMLRYLPTGFPMFW